MAGSDLHFVAMLGSLRGHSRMKGVADTLDELAPDDVAVTMLQSVGTFPHYCGDLTDQSVPEEVRVMGDAIAAADGVIIVTPEYNSSLPGALKNALDWMSHLSTYPFKTKPVAIQTGSQSELGGVRAQSHLREVLASLDASVFDGPAVFISRIDVKVDDTTAMLRDAATRDEVSAQLAAFSIFVRQGKKLA